MKLSILLILTAAAIAAGCGNNATNNNTSTPNAESYSRDGLLGTSQSNPNLPTSPTYHNYAGDVNMIHDAVMKITGVKDSRIMLRGADAVVNLDIADNIGIEDAMRIKREAQDAVSRQMPRYHVRVNVNKNNMIKNRQ